MADNYIVGPTDADYRNAFWYANYKVAKEICESKPDVWEWVEDNIAGFPCPAGLDCVSGMCKYTENGCRAASKSDVYDCERTTVPCQVDGETRTCDVCIFDINTDFPFGKTKLPKIPPPTNEEDVYTKDCWPGYSKNPTPWREGDTTPESTCSGLTYTKHPRPYVLTTADGDVMQSCSADNQCNPPFGKGVCITKERFPEADKNYIGLCTYKSWVPTPYLLDGEKVPCNAKDDADQDSACSATRGRCITKQDFPDAADNEVNFCYDPGPGYLEYHPAQTLWEGEPPTAECVQTYTQPRVWCEMPWSRVKADKTDASKTLDEQIKADPVSLLHPPFWYDDSTGKCYVTAHYCMGSEKDGGYDLGYGVANDYLMGLVSNCTGNRDCDPFGKCEVKDGMDCCRTWEESFMQLIMGRTMSTWIKDIAAGNATTKEMIEASGAARAAYGFLSDDRLKEQRTVEWPDAVAPGVSLYSFSWSPLAHELYPRALTRGRRMGLMASELARAFPEYVHDDPNGFRRFALPGPMTVTDEALRRAVNVLAWSEFAAIKNNPL